MFFSYDPLDCFQRHETAEEAEAACRYAADEHRDIASDEGWPEEAGDVCWGEIRQRLTETSRRPVDPNNDFVSPIEFDEIVEMDLLPKAESDAFNPIEYAARQYMLSLMSEISEECYCAGWEGGLEFSLWSLITDDLESGFGQCDRGDIQSHLDMIKLLSDRLGGWWIWNPDDDCDWAKVNTWVPLEEWKVTYAKHKGREA